MPRHCAGAPIREVERLLAENKRLRLEHRRMSTVLGYITEAAYRFQQQWVIEAIKRGMEENAALKDPTP